MNDGFSQEQAIRDPDADFGVRSGSHEQAAKTIEYLARMPLVLTRFPPTCLGLMAVNP